MTPFTPPPRAGGDQDLHDAAGDAAVAGTDPRPDYEFPGRLGAAAPRATSCAWVRTITSPAVWGCRSQRRDVHTRSRGRRLREI
jgi:hypothetical protein